MVRAGARRMIQAANQVRRYRTQHSDRDSNRYGSSAPQIGQLGIGARACGVDCASGCVGAAVGSFGWSGLLKIPMCFLSLVGSLNSLVRLILSLVGFAG